MGKGQYVRLGFSGSLERAQVDFSFTEPHFLDRNLAAGFDLFHKEVDFTNVASYPRAQYRRQSSRRIPHRLQYPARSPLPVRARRDLRRRRRRLARGHGRRRRGLSCRASASPLPTTPAIFPKSPTSGVFVSFSQDLAGVGGDVNYLREVVDGRAYYPLTNKIILVGRVQGGYINGWGGEDVRMTDLFFKGGETIRGFERAGIGPRDACRSPSTGKPVKSCTRGPVGRPSLSGRRRRKLASHSLRS